MATAKMDEEVVYVGSTTGGAAQYAVRLPRELGRVVRQEGARHNQLAIVTLSAVKMGTSTVDCHGAGSHCKGAKAVALRLHHPWMMPLVPIASCWCKTSYVAPYNLLNTFGGAIRVPRMDRGWMMTACTMRPRKLAALLEVVTLMCKQGPLSTGTGFGGGGTISNWTTLHLRFTLG